MLAAEDAGGAAGWDGEAVRRRGGFKRSTNHFGPEVRRRVRECRITAMLNKSMRGNRPTAAALAALAALAACCAAAPPAQQPPTPPPVFQDEVRPRPAATLQPPLFPRVVAPATQHSPAAPHMMAAAAAFTVRGPPAAGADLSTPMRDRQPFTFLDHDDVRAVSAAVYAREAAAAQAADGGAAVGYEATVPLDR